MDRVTELQRCFALVRPVGMTDSAARDWLLAAAAECGNMSDQAFKEGAATARRECTHHGQIVPTILKAKVESAPTDRFLSDWHNSVRALAGARKPQIADQRTEAQKLIEQATDNLTRR